MFYIILDKVRIKPQLLFFYVAYTLFFLSLFLGDIYQADNKIGQISRLLRFLTYFFSVLAFLISEFKVKSLGKIVLVLIISSMFLFLVKDAYLISLFFLVYAGKEISVNLIFKLSYILLLCGTTTVLFLNRIGVIPDVMTSLAFSFDMSRHSFGFYHSDVLPGIFVYLQVFYTFIHKKESSRFTILVFMIIHLILFCFCKSRACFIVGVTLSISLFIVKSINHSVLLKKVIGILAKYIALICSVISILGMFLVNKFTFMYKIDVLFSFRLTYAAQKMSRIGLKLINLLDNNSFYGSDNFVVDNGYLFIALRYGLLILLGIIVINLLIQKRYNNDLFVENCIIFIFVLSYIDNDFLSYGFLPIIIASFNNNVNDNRAGCFYGSRVSFCNNERI